MKLFNLGKINISEAVKQKMEKDLSFFLSVKLALNAYENGIFDEKAEQHLSDIKNNKEISAVYPANSEKIVITTTSSRSLTTIGMA